MKKRKVIALIMTLMMVFSIFGGSTSAVFAEGEGGGDSSASGLLSEVALRSGSAATSDAYKLEPEFSPDVHDYDIIMTDSKVSTYVWATLAESASGGKITAKWSYYTNNRETSTTVTSGNSTGKSLSNLQQMGGPSGRTLTLEVTKGSETQTYKFTTKLQRSLSGLTVKANGSKLIMSPSFDRNTKEYTVKTGKNTESVTLDTSLYSNYNVTVDGKAASGDSTEVSLGDSDSKVIPIKVSYGSDDNSTAGEYQVTVNRVDAAKATIKTDPADAIIRLEDAAGEKVKAAADGTYSLMPGDKYTYTVTKTGYVCQSGELSIDRDTVKEIKLEKAAENSKIDKNIKAEWKNFRNSDVNMGITDAKTPTSLKSTNLRWAKKYGTGWAAAPCIQIIVKGKVFTIVGTKIYQLDPKTGEVEKEGQLVGQTNWGYTPMTYADGMIFCPLANGTIQAVNADTLESLWVYKDPLGGQSLSPITYSDGYIYTGFWNSETKDANYVCLSVTDEDTTKTDESKLATWRFTQTGGFYWAGSVAVGDALIFGTDDGTSSYNQPSKLYSVNKYTGEVISDCDITGDQRSTIAYDKESGRVYGTTKAGYLFSAAVDAKTGKLSDLKDENYNAQSTSTPVVYKGKVYFATGSGISSTGSSGNLVVAEADTLKMDYAIGMKGYPQSSLLMSTAYEESTGYIYLYSTYNAMPGGVSMIKTKPDNTKAEGAELTEIYDADGYSQYCITSIICDTDGTLYYKNDSCNIFALESNEAYIEDMDITGGNAELKKEFKSGTDKYEAVVDAGTKSVDIKIKTAEGAEVTVNDEKMTSDTAKIELKDGRAETVFIVKHGTQSRTYTVNLREKSDNAELSSLQVNESNSYSSFKTLDPEFAADKTTYTMYNAGASRSFENIWPEAKDQNAGVKVYAIYGIDDEDMDDSSTGEIDVTASSSGHDRYAIYFGTGTDTTAVRVEVTAEDGKTVKNYYVTFTKQNDAVTLLPVAKAVGNDLLDRIDPAPSYDQAEQDEVNLIVKDAKRQLKSAEDAEDVETIIAKAKHDISKIETKADKEKAEQEKADREKEKADLEKENADQKAEIDKLKEQQEKDKAEREAEKAQQEKENADQKAEIDKLKEQQEKDKAEREAEKAQQAAKEALQVSKKAAVKELKAEASDLSVYRLGEQVKVMALMMKGQALIEDAEDEAAVKAALETAKAELAEIKTDAELTTEELQAAKTTVSVKAADYKTAKITWKAVDNADKYQVYRSTSKNSGYSRIATVSGKSLKDAKLKTGKTYYYKVRAYAVIDGSDVYSGYSSVKSVKTSLGKVSSIKLETGKAKVTVKWSKVKGASGYKIYRSTKKSSGFKCVKTVKSGSTVKYVNSNLKKGRTYYYKVRAYRTVDGKKVYGAYSSAKNVRVYTTYNY